MVKRVVCFLLSLVILLSLISCTRQEAKIYEQVQQKVDENPIPEKIREDLKPVNGHRPTFYSENNPAVTPAPDDELSGTLTVKMDYWGPSVPPRVVQLAEEFMLLHPNVIIRFDYPEDFLVFSNYTAAERLQWQESHREKIRVEMMSRKADYIIYDTENQLSGIPQLSENGMLVDMKPYFESDPDIQSGEYFEEMLKAFEADGKLTTVPFSFYYDSVFLNKSVLEKIGVDYTEISNVTTEQLIDWYEQARELEPDLQMFFMAAGKDNLFDAERKAYMDIENEKASFNSPEFIRFLERTADFIDDDPEVHPDEKRFNFGPIADEVLNFQETGQPPSRVLNNPAYREAPSAYHAIISARRSFAALESVSMPTLTLLDQPLEYMAGPYPLLSSDGKLGVSSEDDFVVPSSCSNPELAWEFIKYCINERESMSFETDHWYSTSPIMNDIPVNVDTFRSMAEFMPDYVKSSYTPGYNYFAPVNVSSLEKKLREVLELELVNKSHYNISMDDYLDEYYVNELTTAEECAQKIQERAVIWLNE